MEDDSISKSHVDDLINFFINSTYHIQLCIQYRFTQLYYKNLMGTH